MAKPKAPLLSLGARGSLGDLLTHRRHKGITVAETKPIPTDHRTPAQLIQRALFRLGCDWWPAIPETQRWLYHQMNPQIGANPAFLNFMKEWLMTEVVSHHEQHEDGGADEMDLTGLQGAGGFDWPLYLKVGRYHFSPLITHGTTTSASVIPANWIGAIPFPVSAQMTFDRIGITIQTGAAGLIRLGIYADNGQTYPGALLLDAGTIDCTIAGLKVITINQQLPPGLHWLATLPNATPKVWYTANNYHGLLGSTNGRSQSPSYRKGQAFGPLPDPYPPAASLELYFIYTVLRRSA